MQLQHWRRRLDFDVNKADWLKYQAKQTLELSDEELEGVAAGVNPPKGDWVKDCFKGTAGL